VTNFISAKRNSVEVGLTLFL